ncbi:MAG TPA: low-complexity protein, partial [Cyanobacteria bacterium UBA11148]|nr:low-complexity protein [Cyanobacteria bacterium UBA11148]
NLSKVDLRMASLREANLNWADVTRADLSEADLQSTQLNQSNLAEAKLNKTQLVSAELMAANLCYASLIRANLSNANLREAQLEAAHLREAILVGVNLTEANLHAVDLRGSNLSEADLHRVILTDANLNQANGDRADFSRANLTGAYLLKAIFSNTNFFRAVLQDVYLLHTDLSNANLQGADLRRADLSGAYLQDTILTEANLSGAYLLESYLIRTQLDRAELTGCCIHNWHLEDVDLSNVNCRYLFTQFNHTTNSPSDRYPVIGNLLPGDFTLKNTTNKLTLEIEFQHHPNWEVLVFTLLQLEGEWSDLKLKIESYECRFGHYCLRLSANPVVKPQRLHQRILQLYPQMYKRFHNQRQSILELLELDQPHKRETQSLRRSAPQPIDQEHSADHQWHLYQTVVYQIERIIMSQPPEKIVEGVQRLLKFLKEQNIATEEIHKQFVTQTISKRVTKDPLFQKQLLEWQETTNNSGNVSSVEQAMYSAISIILGNNNLRVFP